MNNYYIGIILAFVLLLFLVGCSEVSEIVNVFEDETQQKEDNYPQQIQEEQQRQYEQKQYEEELRHQEEEDREQSAEELQQQEEIQPPTSSLCQSGYIKEYRCNGNNIQQKYQYKDCNIDWIKSELCNYGCSDGKCNSAPCEENYLNEYKCEGNLVYQEYQYLDCNTIWRYKKYCQYGCNDGECNPKPQEYAYDMSLCKGSADCFVGTVGYIFDGDTLIVNGIIVRLALTNTPESDEMGFYDAKQFTEKLCPVGSSVLVDEDDGQINGSYDRTIAVVYCGNYNLNEWLLKLGYGQIWIEYCKVSEFRNEDWAVKYGC